MKKAYAKPTATKVDFEYKDHVTAQSGGEIGTHGRPAHPFHCQYKTESCSHFYDSGYGCEQLPPDSLNLYL